MLPVMPARNQSKAVEEALRVASLVEPPLTVGFLESCNITEPLLNQLIDSGALHTGPKPGQLEFPSAAAQARVVAKMTWSMKRKLHARIAGAAVSHRLPAETAAHHFSEANLLEKARQQWYRAAEHACAQSDYQCALGYFTRALDIWPWSEDVQDRIDGLRSLARCAANAGDKESLERSWEELRNYATDAGDHPLRIEALTELSRLFSDPVRSTAALREAAELATEALPPNQAARSWIAYAELLAIRVRIHQSLAALEQAEKLTTKTKDAALESELLGWKGLVLSMAGRADEATALVEESLRIAIRNELTEQTAIAYRRRANICEYAGDYKGEAKSHLAAIQFCRNEGLPGEQMCHSCLSYALFRTGEWKAALESARTVLSDPGVHPALEGIARCTLGLVAVFRGERKSAESELQKSLTLLRREGVIGLEFFCLWGQAYLHESNGAPEAAAPYYDEVRALWRETDDVHDVIPALLFAGNVYRSTSRIDCLADSIDIARSIERINPLAEAAGASAALRGERALLDGNHEEACKHFEEAAKRYAPAKLLIESAWVSFRLAAAKQSMGIRTSATPEIQVANRLGMRPLVSVFNALGKSSPDHDLTPRQLDVLRMLAEGLTSKEAADRLSLSPRTVEMHVARLMQRLNCRTRPEAIQTAMQRGWLGPHS